MRGNVGEGFIGPNTVEDEGTVAAKFLSVKDQANVGVFHTQVLEKIPVYPVAGERKRKGDLILSGDFAHNPARFDDFGGLRFLRNGIQFRVATGVRTKDKAFRLHFADLGAGEKGLAGIEITRNVEFEGLADLIDKGFIGLLVPKEPGSESGN